jgi:hypothetical protein
MVFVFVRESCLKDHIGLEGPRALDRILEAFKEGNLRVLPKDLLYWRRKHIVVSDCQSQKSERLQLRHE